MARKSIDFATSLKRFHRKDDGENLVRKTAEIVEKSPINPELSSSSEDSHHTKLLLQNQSLLKTNSSLVAKVKALEQRVSDLFEENIQRRNNSELELNKKLLETRLIEVENCLIQSYNDVFDKLQTIRQDFRIGLSKNIQKPKSVSSTNHSFYLPAPIIPTVCDKTSASKQPMTALGVGENLTNTSSTKNASATAKSPDVSVIMEESEKDESFRLDPGGDTFDFGSDMDISKRSSMKNQSSPPPQKLPGKTFEIYQDKEIEKQETVKPQKVQNEDDIQNKHNLTNSENILNRPRRNRKAISYKPIPLGAKLRRESSTFVDAVDENAFHFAVSESRKSTKKRKVSKSQPLVDSTNFDNNSQNSFKKSSELDIFDFEEEIVTKPNKGRRQTINI